MNKANFVKVTENIWEIPPDYKAGMNVPARIYSSAKLIDGIDERVIDQITNVACLPGIQKYSYCMPDGHVGYGFPIGGVAAFNIEEGIISPGGIGFDINCGMRLLRTNLTLDDIKPKMEALLNDLFATVPSGVGSSGYVKLKNEQFRQIMTSGVGWCVENGYASENDREHVENNGCLDHADPEAVSSKAVSRGITQMGTLGSGNHYLEVEIAAPENIFDRAAAERYGINLDNQVLVSIHCGSRGFGHQIATDYLQVFSKCAAKYGLTVRDKELMSAPIDSEEGRKYFNAMACAANAAFVNRQLIVHGVRSSFERVFKESSVRPLIETIYDVAHNIAKREVYEIDGQKKTLLVHRKGATRSFGPGRREIPEKYRSVGQPVIVGGSMESGSALLRGTGVADETTFGSSLHGAGRTMSRIKAKQQMQGGEVKNRMKERGILVKTGYMKGLSEEAGYAYKNIDLVTEAVDAAGISKKVARFYPVLNIKG